MRLAATLLLLAVGSIHAQEGGGPIPDLRDAIAPSELARAEKAIAEYEASLPISKTVLTEEPRSFAFFPLAGIFGSDIFLNNAVDLDSTTAIKDFECTQYTYDGHRGWDVDLISFRVQDLGVPVFAALDGTVVDARDGEPDTNTAMVDVPANYVILHHGGTHYTWYWHLKKGSVAVVKNQTVTGGTQLGLAASSGYSTGPHLHLESRLAGKHYEPSSGPCRNGASYWSNPPSIRRDSFIREFSFGPESYQPYKNPPWDDAPRTGTFVRGARTVYFKIILPNLPVSSSYAFRFVRPDGTVATQSAASFNNAVFYRYSWWWWGRSVTLEPVGRWRLEFDLNGSRLFTAPFDVVSTGGDVVNRPPNGVSVAIAPEAPSSGDVAFCRVGTSLVTEDPDYDYVRYRYQWIVGGRIVREVTTGALSDALPKGIARPGDQVQCRVTPSDGRLDGFTGSASATFSGGSRRRRTARR